MCKKKNSDKKQQQHKKYKYERTMNAILEPFSKK